MIYLDILTVVCIGLLIGTEFTVSVFINPVLQRLDTGTRMKTSPDHSKRALARCNRPDIDVPRADQQQDDAARC